MRKVYTHENLIILQTAKGLLEHNGIDCFVKNEYHASGGHVGLVSVPLELWVKNTTDAASAVAILKKELSDSNRKPVWVCNKCNEENDGSFETCWKCQTENVGT